MKKILLSLLSLLYISANAYTQPAATIQTGTYIIKSAIGGKNMDVINGNNANGVGLHLWDAHGGDAQQFRIEPTNEAGYYYIKTKWGRAVDVAGYNRNSGASLNTYDVHGGDNQKWKFIDVGGGYYNIQSKYGTYIDVRGGGSASGTQIWMSAYSTWGNNIAQRWKLEAIIPSFRLPTPIFNVNRIVIYSQANYQGQSVTFSTSDANARLPFTSSTISVQVPTGYVAFINTYCNSSSGVPTTYAIMANRPNVPIYGGICGIRIARLAYLKVLYQGISTNIHNNDCKRFYGKVTLNMSDDKGIFPMLEPSSTQYGLVTSSNITVVDWNRGDVRGVFNNNPIPYLPTDDLIAYTFAVDADALAQNKITLNINSNLGSAHKGCDLCTDFTWEAKMSQLVRENIRMADALQQGGSVSLGPYRTTDNRHDIRVHFFVKRN